MSEIRAPISPGELIDKITILQIKQERFADARQLRNVAAELAVLSAVRDQGIVPSPEMDLLTAELKVVNEKLWQVENDLRICERDRDFGPRFIEFARSVYRHNDRRCALKREINLLLGSKLVEEKSYAG